MLHSFIIVYINIFPFPAAMFNASSTFFPNGLPENPNYTYHHHHYDQLEFDLSDFLVPDNGSSIQGFLSSYGLDDPSLMAKEVENSTRSGDTPSSSNISIGNSKSTGVKKVKKDLGSRIAFKMKSEKEIIDDGFKWRKYGKKKVKNSPNPRNYYRCSSGGCHVKKRVERDPQDSSYVITTYDGMHNHESPCVVYYDETPLMVPNGWTLQASHSPN